MSPVLQVPAKVGVLGGGRMGAGIAHAFLASGASVTVVDINEDAVAAARERVHKAIRGSLERGAEGTFESWDELSLIHISEPTRRTERSRMPSSA